MILPGKYYKLEVKKKVRMGYLLKIENDIEILLPATNVTAEIENEQKLRVFVYQNSRRELVATLQTPHIVLNEFAFLQVKSNTDKGTFLDWGLDKDLFIPFSEQLQKMREGNSYVVYMYYDKKSQRLAASAKTNKFLETKQIDIKKGQEVKILITNETELGFSVIIDNRYKGMVYKNEIYKTIHIGNTMTAWVKNIREDGKVDVSLQQLGYKNIDHDAEAIMRRLQSEKGVLALTDKSSPEAIMSELQISKKAFKRAVRNLLKQHLIIQKDDGIYLKKK